MNGRKFRISGNRSNIVSGEPEPRRVRSWHRSDPAAFEAPLLPVVREVEEGRSEFPFQIHQHGERAVRVNLPSGLRARRRGVRCGAFPDPLGPTF